MELYQGYKLGRRSKLGGTRRNSGGGKYRKERSYGKTNREDFIGKTIQPIY